MANERDGGGWRWTVECRKAPDDSGDMIVDLPADFLSDAGFKIGDVFTLEIAGEGMILTRLASPAGDAKELGSGVLISQRGTR